MPLKLGYPTPVKSDQCQWNDNRRQHNMGKQYNVIQGLKITGIQFWPALKPVINNVAY